jgi:hypothetical protein
MVEPSDWHRFSHYARRVRRFRYDCQDTEATISLSALEEIAQTRTTLSVLPNLRDLTWTQSCPILRRFSVLFMNENVRSFTFVLNSDDQCPCQPFFQDIVARMPFLTQVDMRTSHFAQDIEADFLQLISGLPKLQKVVVPLYHITSKVMEGLSRIDNLGTVQFEFLGSQGSGTLEDLQVFNPALAEDAFPALWDLSLSAHLTHFTNFIKDPFAPSYLTSIYVHAISVGGETAVHQFFSAIADHCPLVEALYLECLPGPTLTTQPASEFEQLTLNTLKPLHNCLKLTTFELIYPIPLVLTMDDLEELTSKWPSLEVISLNAEPVLEIDVRSNLTLRAILPFARNCPNLRKLGLFFDATAADIPSHAEVPNPFAKLAELRVGVSSIAEVGPVALFLSRVCPVGCSVMTGVSWPYMEFGPPLSWESSIVVGKWCKVKPIILSVFFLSNVLCSNFLMFFLLRIALGRSRQILAFADEVEDGRTRDKTRAAGGGGGFTDS